MESFKTLPVFPSSGQARLARQSCAVTSNGLYAGAEALGKGGVSASGLVPDIEILSFRVGVFENESGWEQSSYNH